MKTLALLISLCLQVTGLWPHAPESVRTKLTQAAVTTMAQAKTLAIAPPAVSNWALPVRLGAEPLATTSGASIIAFDRATAQPLFEQASTKTRPIASITKLVTALVILSHHNASETVIIPTLPSYIPEAERLGLMAGETYRVGDLVQAALVPSANDAADALAIWDSGSITKFAAQMNLKLAQWDIAGARFNNPSGLEDEGNYASAQALGRIAVLALEHPFIRDTVTQDSGSITSGAGRTSTFISTNKLLAGGRFYGIKTGYTLASGECFVGLTKVNGHEVITVVLGSTDRFGETTRLTNWIGRNYQWL